MSPQTYKNNCFHVPESLARPSDRGSVMEGCTVERMGGCGELVKEEIPEKKLGNNTDRRLCSAAGSDNQPPALSSPEAEVRIQ